MTDTPDNTDKVRIDKWLWAARFFKTRTLAKTAIEGGKVQLAGQRVKVSREITAGDVLRIRQGWDERDVVVKAVSEQRRGAPIAQTLYEETTESIARRERAAERAKRPEQWLAPRSAPANMSARRWSDSESNLIRLDHRGI